MSLLGWIVVVVGGVYVSTHLRDVAGGVGRSYTAARDYALSVVEEAMAPLPRGARRTVGGGVLVLAAAAGLRVWRDLRCAPIAAQFGAAAGAQCRSLPVWWLAWDAGGALLLFARANLGLAAVAVLYVAFRRHMRAAGVRRWGRWAFAEFVVLESPGLLMSWAGRVLRRGRAVAVAASGEAVVDRLRARSEEAEGRRAAADTRRWAATAAVRLVDAVEAAGGDAYRELPASPRRADAPPRSLVGAVLRRYLDAPVRVPLVRVTWEVAPTEVRFTVRYLAAPTRATLEAWRVVARETAAPTLGLAPAQVHAEGSLRLRVSLVVARGAAPGEDDDDEDGAAPPPVVDTSAPLSVGCPPLTLLPPPIRGVGRPNEGRTVAARVVSALGALDVPGAEVAGVDVGPAAIAVTVRPPRGVRGSLVLRTREDLAIELAAPSLRMAASPTTPGCILVEVPRDHPAPVALRSVVGSAEFRGAAGALPVAFGVDTAGRPVVADLAALPHLLAAGTTGSGKTVALHGLIVSLLLRLPPTRLRLLLIDPKWTEFSAYDGLPHLLCPCITEVPPTVALLAWLAGEMDRRYRLLADMGVQDLASFNRAAKQLLPRIVAVCDEIADTMLGGKRDQREEVQRLLARLLSKARAAGIHLVLATQRPTADVLPGLVKSNAPARLALAVQSELDSRIILDQAGAEALGGRGDALLALPGARAPVRVQSPWIPREAVEAVVSWWAGRCPVEYDPALLAALAAAGMEVPVEAAPMAPVMAPPSPGAVGPARVADDDGWRWFRWR